MVRKTFLHALIKAHDFTLIEKHLIFSFLINRGLSLVDSPILLDYFKDFQTYLPIAAGISGLNIASLKELENCLEQTIPDEDRKLNGAYFTPNFIIDFIIQEIHPQKNHSNFDPSCGSGAFLLGLMQYYKKKLGQSIRETIRKNIFGSDILEYNIRRTKLILTIHAMENGEILKEEDFNLWVRDSLRTNWEMSFDNILSNPPYVKFQDLSSQTRAYLSRHWDTIEGGTFNLYFAFFELGYRLLKTSGKLAYITPNNYFTSLSGESLRRYFHQKKCITRILDFSYRKVFDAHTYTAITFLNKEQNESIVFDRINDSQSPKSFLEQVGGSPNYLKDLSVRKWRLLKTDEQENIKTIENIGTAVGELFDISAGIATLKDDIYFLDGSCQKDGFYEKDTVQGKFRIEKGVTRRVYKISDFKNQKEAELNTRRIICPYDIQNGLAIPFPEKEFRKKFPECYQYFLSEKKALMARDKGKVNFEPFFVWGRTQGLTKFGKRILTPTFSQYPRFLMTEKTQSYFTNGYGITPRTEEKTTPMSGKGMSRLGSPENMDIVQSILNSIVMHYYIIKTSVVIDGGYPCYQKNFIEKFSIPSFSDQELTLIRSLRDSAALDELLISKYQLNFSGYQTISKFQPRRV